MSGKKKKGLKPERENQKKQQELGKENKSRQQTTESKKRGTKARQNLDAHVSNQTSTPARARLYLAEGVRDWEKECHPVWWLSNTAQQCRPHLPRGDGTWRTDARTSQGSPIINEASKSEKRGYFVELSAASG
jgi:primase-polymerase (primpol)-like protein